MATPERIGLIAGNGRFPLLFAEAAHDPVLLDVESPALETWLDSLRDQVRGDALDPVARTAGMQAASPLYLPRNHLAHLAIEAATHGDIGVLDRLMTVLRTPYAVQAEAGDLAARAPDWAFETAGCSMLSCSS